jgi:flagellar protein FliL
MSEATAAEAPPRKSSKMPMILGLVLAILGGGGGFYAVQSGLIGGSESHAEAPMADLPPPIAPVAYVAIDPITVNMPRSSGHQFLRITAQVEVAPEHQAEVEPLKPRIIDVMNSFLRAVEPADFEDQLILEELRGHLLHRIAVVTGEGRVRDLLIQEFLLN